MTRRDGLASLFENFAGPQSPRALEIAAMRTSRGSPVGIFGARPCQICAVLDCYRGFAVTLYVAHIDGDVVCRRCQDAIIPHEIFGISAQHEIVRAQLAGRRHRFCECCGSQYPTRRERRSGPERRICAPCVAVIEAGQVEDLEAFLLVLRRLRYVNLTCGSPQSLGAFGRRMKRAREEVESGNVPPGHVMRITAGHGIEVELRLPGSI